MADIIGIDQLLQHIAPLNVVSISFYSKPKDKHPFFVAHREHGPILEQIKDYCIQQENAGNEYAGRLIRIRHEAKDGKFYEQTPTFAIMQKESRLQVNGPPAPAATDSNLMGIYVELGYLRAEVARLRTENSDLLNQIDEIESLPDEMGSVTATDKAREYIELFNQAAPILGAIFGSKPAPAQHTVNGPPDSLTLGEIVNQLSNIDPELKTNLGKLLQLAKNKPDIYKLAILQLDNFL